jgi:tetratricopeptide (TPR) repeat protein
MLSPKEGWNQYGPYMAKTRQLDPYLVESNAGDADYKWFYQWNWSGAEATFRRGIELSPGNTEIHRLFGEFLRSQGRWEETIRMEKEAQELDPFSLTINKSLGVAYFWAKRYDEALDQLKKTVELDPNFADVHDSIADVYVRKGMYKDAIEETAIYLKLSGDEESAAQLKTDFEKFGYSTAIQNQFQRQLEILKENSEQGYISPMFFVFTYIHLNRKDDAFHWLDEAYKERSPWLVFMKTDPQFDSIRSDPRFAAMMKKVGL